MMFREQGYVCREINKKGLAQKNALYSIHKRKKKYIG